MPDQPTDAGKDRAAIQNAVRLAEVNRQARIEQDGDEAIATIADALNSEMRECGLPECDPTLGDIKATIRLLVDCLRADVDKARREGQAQERAKYAGWFPHACKIIQLCQCGANWTCQICGEGAGAMPCDCFRAREPREEPSR